MGEADLRVGIPSAEHRQSQEQERLATQGDRRPQEHLLPGSPKQLCSLHHWNSCSLISICETTSVADFYTMLCIPCQQECDYHARGIKGRIRSRHDLATCDAHLMNTSESTSEMSRRSPQRSLQHHPRHRPAALLSSTAHSSSFDPLRKQSFVLDVKSELKQYE